MMNKERSELGLVNRYRSLNCKKAAEWHLNYLMKYNSISTEGHLESKTLGNKILKTPDDRYRFYEKDSSKVCLDDYCYYNYDYDYISEICNWRRYSNVSGITNKSFAKDLYEQFKSSSGHYKAIIYKSTSESIHRGFFVCGYKKLENGKHDFYSVAIFDYSNLHQSKKYDKYKEDFKKLY